MGLFNISSKDQPAEPIKYKYFDAPAGHPDAKPTKISKKAQKAVRSVRKRLAAGTLQTTPAAKALEDLKKAIKKPAKKKK